MAGSRVPLVRGVLVPGVLALLLLAGCAAPPDDGLETELGRIGGVAEVEVDATGVHATLVADLPAADAQTALVALRDDTVGGHDLGPDAGLVVVVPVGSRDLGGPQPWPVVAVGEWTAGAAAGDAFAQQAAFVASLADTELLLTTPAQVLHVRFAASGVAAPAETPGAGDPAATDPPVDDGAAAGEGDTAAQVLEVSIGQSFHVVNAKADIDALVAELEALWVASGGLPEAIEIR
jgi:hypothetical protein